MYSLIATEKSERSSLLVLEMEGSKPQSRWEMGPCSRITVNMHCAVLALVSALGTEPGHRDWAHIGCSCF